MSRQKDVGELQKKKTSNMRRKTQDYKGPKEVEGFVDEKTITNITQLPTDCHINFRT
jgi:hypothetical protein